MLRGGLVLMSLASASAAYEDSLSRSDFDLKVFGTPGRKAAFIKFFAPWCGHCKQMAASWDDLGEAYEDSTRTLVGSVDCDSDEGRPVCKKHGVEGYPTLMYFSPPEREGEIYEGARSPASLAKFAKMLDERCDVREFDGCTAEARAELQPLVDMEPAELRKAFAKLQRKLRAAKAETLALDDAMQELSHPKSTISEEEKTARLDELQRKLDAALEKHKALQTQHGHEYRLMQSVVVALPAEPEGAAEGGAARGASRARAGAKPVKKKRKKRA